MKVWRMLERIVAGAVGLGWWIRPTPNLLAEPSRPRDIMFEVGRWEEGWLLLGGVWRRDGLFGGLKERVS